MHFFILKKLFNRTDYMIDRYLDGSMSEAERERFEQQYFENRTLFDKLQKRSALRQQLTAMLKQCENTVLHPQERREVRTRRAWIKDPGSRRKLGWAGAALATLGLVLLIFIVWPEEEGSFAVNPALEKELGSRLLRSQSVSVLAPTLSQKVSGAITFAWDTGPKPPFEVILIDHAGAEIASWQTDEYALHRTLDHPPGLYYWKLLSQDEWIYTGKIILAQP